MTLAPSTGAAKTEPVTVVVVDEDPPESLLEPPQALMRRSMDTAIKLSGNRFKDFM
jgi:hypothetical protein